MVPREPWSGFGRRGRALRGSAENVHFGCNEGKGGGVKVAVGAGEPGVCMEGAENLRLCQREEGQSLGGS